MKLKMFIHSHLNTGFFKKNINSVALVFFILLHVVLFNINVSEWGDSFRILRASEFLRAGSYPVDEKRPILFSLLISLRPAFIDQVSFGRGVVLVFSILSFIVFLKLLNKFADKFESKLLGLILFVFNPVYLYWSIRVMADIPFGFFALLGIFLIMQWRSELNLRRIITLSAISTLAVMTRFEGYILLASIFAGILLPEINTFNPLQLLKKITPSAVRVALLYLFLFVLMIIPNLLFRNPFGSSYFEEPAGRSYDLKMVWIYTASLLFIFGSTLVPAQMLFGLNKVLNFLKKHTSLFVFLAADLSLCLLWPAAIPRLFVPSIPFLVILAVIVFEDIFKAGSIKPSYKLLALNVLAILFYAVSQYFLKLQFLVLIKPIFILTIIIQIVVLFTVYFRKNSLTLLLIFISTCIWSVATIWIHKDIFISVKNGAVYAGENLKGNIAYNDVSSVSDWYINYRYKNPGRRGFYYYTEKKQQLEYGNLVEADIDYLLITNEHNTTMELDLQSRQYLQEMAEFRYNVNGSEFFTKIIRVKR